MRQQKLFGIVLVLIITLTAASVLAAPIRVRGKVITTGEDRVVIQSETGGQMTLETKNEDVIKFIGLLKESDRIEAEYTQGDGGHYHIRSIALVVRGKVITTGEDRVVIQSDKGGQMTLEVATIRRSGKLMKHQGQMRFISLIKEGDVIEAAYHRSHHGGHFIIADYYGSLAGVVSGKVITTGEDRVVVQSNNGGQLTLEAGWVKRGNRWGRNEDQIRFFHSLKPRDKIEATWMLDEGTHYIVRTIAKIGPDGKRIFPSHTLKHARTERASLENRLRAMQEEIAQLKREVAELKVQLRKLAK